MSDRSEVGVAGCGAVGRVKAKTEQPAPAVLQALSSSAGKLAVKKAAKGAETCNKCNASLARFRCSRCDAVAYCSAECQKLDWKGHKTTCFTPAEVEQQRLALKKTNEELVRASMNGDLPLIHSLIKERGADVAFHFQELKRRTALLSAVEKRRMEISEILITQYGAHVDDFDSDGMTSLYYASDKGYVELVHLLLRHGANVNKITTNRETNSCLTIASENCHPDCVVALIAAGANVNHVRNDASTSLILAAKKGCEAAVRALLGAGADPRIELPNGWTALHMAKHFKHLDIAALIEAAMGTEGTSQEGVVV